MKHLTQNLSQNPDSPALLFEQEYVKIYYNPTDKWIYADWIGYQTTETIKTGSEFLLQAIKETKSYKLINDNTNITGMKAKTIEWLVSDFAPRLQEGGLQYKSWIYKNNSHSEMSADIVLGLSQTEIIVIVFDNVATAEKWLRTVH